MCSFEERLSNTIGLANDKSDYQKFLKLSRKALFIYKKSGQRQEEFVGLMKLYKIEEICVEYRQRKNVPANFKKRTARYMKRIEKFIGLLEVRALQRF